MKQTLIFLIMCTTLFNSCDNGGITKNGEALRRDDNLSFKSGYSQVNGLRMYYEIYGTGKPLVLIHGGGSTIQTTFGRIIPELTKTRQVIGVELQAHGRTSDRNTDLSFEQDADDVAALLKNLNIDKSDFFGFSNGGTTVAQIAIRHPEMVDRIIVGSALFKRDGVPSQFWDFMKQAKVEQMPGEYKDAYQKVAPNPEQIRTLHDKCAKRMIDFKDIPDEQIKSIAAPTLLISADKDVMTPAHAVEVSRLIPNCRLAIIPGIHGQYIGEITTLKDAKWNSEAILPIIEQFLEQP